VVIGDKIGDISAKNSSPLSQGLTLAPSRNERFPVRFQELQTTTFPVTTQTNFFPSVPLGMEFICIKTKTEKKLITILRP